MSSKPEVGGSHRSFAEKSRHYFSRGHTRVPDQKLDVPAAWMGQELRTQLQQGNAPWCYRLSDTVWQNLSGLRRQPLRIWP
jgi:hypothetical protein